MKKLIVVLAVSSSSAGPALASGIIYDPFDYSAAANPPLGTGPSAVAGAVGRWVYQGNNTTEPRIYAGSLNYTGVPAIGNKVQLDNANGGTTGADASRLYIGTQDKATVPTLYYSFVTSIPSTTNNNQNGAFFAGFDNLTAGTAYTTFGGLFVRQNTGDTTNVDLGICTSGSANKAWIGNLPHDTPLYVVGSFTFQGASTLDVFTDPTAVPFAEPAHGATSTNVDASAVTAVTNFYLRGNNGQPQAIKIDEVRIGTSWADVAAHGFVWDIDGAAAAGSGGASPSGNWDGATPNFNTDATGGAGGTVAAAPASLDVVSFGNDATGTYTVTVSGTRAAGAIQLNAGDVTFAAATAGDTLAVGRFDIAAGMSATVSATSAGGGAAGLTKAGAGTLTLTGPVTYTGETRVIAGKLAVVGNLTSTSAVTVSNGSTLELSSGGGSNRVIKTGAVSVTGGAKLDIKDNKLITTTAAGTAAAGVYTGVQGMVQSASNGGAWDGSGITTSMPDAPAGLTSIGVATAEQVLGIAPTDTGTFAGQTVTGSNTIAMYTYAGDANLDGQITGDDYSAIDFNILVPGSFGWYNGDFNYDGQITGDDYSAIDFNILAQGAPFPTSGATAVTVVAVPEPSCTLFAMVTLAFAARRRRRL